MDKRVIRSTDHGISYFVAFLGILLGGAVFSILSALPAVSSPQIGAAFATPIPLALSQNVWWGQTFRHEQKALLKNVQLNAEQGYWYLADFEGIYFNVRQGYRRTAYQPDTFDHTVWLVGSSTVFDLFVPDHLTLASYLQRLAPTGWRVVNAGTVSNLILNEQARIADLPVKQGDIVLWVGGSWETFKLYERLAPNTDCGNATAQAITAGQNALGRVREIKRSLETKNVDLFYILEPLFFSAAAGLPTATELGNIPDAQRFVRSCYPMLAHSFYNTLGAAATDYRAILDDPRRAGRQIFVDVVHRVDVDYDVIAGELAELIGWRMN